MFEHEYIFVFKVNGSSSDPLLIDNGNWNFTLSCSNTILEENDSDLGTYVFEDDRVTWFDAEIYCEENLDTSLGTVQTQSDLNDTISIIGGKIALGPIWLGLYRGTVDDDVKCEWVDG